MFTITSTTFPIHATNAPCAEADRAADEQIDGLVAECARLRSLLALQGIDASQEETP